MKKMILNVDTGIDDAVAIIFSLFSPNINPVAIITSNGNMGVRQITKNTLSVLEFVKKEVPVFKGTTKNFSKKRLKLSGIHGKNGIGGFKFQSPKQKAQKLNKFPKFLEGIKEKVTIVSTAPLSNIAYLLQRYPEIKSKIDKIVIQSGLLSDENYSSFNVAVDPVSAGIVLSSGIKIIICPSDMGHMAFLDKQDVRKIQSYGQVGKMLEFIFRSYKDRAVKNNVATHDSCAVLYVQDKTLFTTKNVFVSVKKSTSGFGVLNFDFKRKPNAEVCTEIDIKAFKNLLFEAVEKADKNRELF